MNRTQVTTTVSGNLVYYDVLNSQGSTSRYTATTQTINASTAFGVSGVTEYTGTLTVIQSVALPDGTSYSFNYDSGAYGLLQSMSLPGGGSITYGFTTFQDSYGSPNRWLNTRTAGSGTWTYTPAVVTTCAPGTVGCQQQTTVTAPSGDGKVYTFTLNNGAWNTETDIYSGPALTGTLLKTITVDYDLSNACPGCPGAIYIQPIRTTTQDPSAGGATLTRKAEYT